MEIIIRVIDRFPLHVSSPPAVFLDFFFEKKKSHTQSSHPVAVHQDNMELAAAKKFFLPSKNVYGRSLERASITVCHSKM